MPPSRMGSEPGVPVGPSLRPTGQTSALPRMPAWLVELMRPDRSASKVKAKGAQESGREVDRRGDHHRRPAGLHHGQGGRGDAAAGGRAWTKSWPLWSSVNERCDPPLPDAQVEKIAGSIARYPPNPDRVKNLDRRPGGVPSQRRHGKSPGRAEVRDYYFSGAAELVHVRPPWTPTPRRTNADPPAARVGRRPSDGPAPCSGTESPRSTKYTRPLRRGARARRAGGRARRAHREAALAAHVGPSETSPLVDGGRVYVGDWSGNVYALSAKPGSSSGTTRPAAR